MKKSGIALGIVAILFAVVLVSGCTSSEKLLFTYNLTDNQSAGFISVQNVTIPNGTSTVKIMAENLTKQNKNINTSNVIFYLLNTIPVSGATGENYTVNILEQKSVDLSNKTEPYSVTYQFNDTQLKGIVIVSTNTAGSINIYTST